MSRPRKGDLPTKRPCTHPGCTVMLSQRYSTYDAGLCQNHGGAKVGKAVVRVFVPPPAKPERPGVRVAEVGFGGFSGSGSEVGVMRVSLVREPWV